MYINGRGLFVFVLLTGIFLPLPCLALYSSGGDSFDLSLVGYTGLGAGFSSYPADSSSDDAGRVSSWSGDFRLIGEAGVGESVRTQVNILQNVRTAPLLFFAGSEAVRKDVERSGLFYWQQHDSANTQAALVLDTTLVKFGNRNNELTIGRQPISTSVTFFFTPNDFFAPFAADTFFKVYKPGVDSVRYERKLAMLSQLTVIGVLGYDSEHDSDSGWSDSPSWPRSSLLFRVTDTAGEFEWGVLAGLVRESLVSGFSLQGELFQWLGVRAEGNYANSWGEGQDSAMMLTLSLEHQFASSLTVRLEQMFNGYGSDSIDDALVKVSRSAVGQGYMGRHYSAFDLSYQVSPLVFGEMLWLHNWSDESSSLSFNTVYSVSDESELAVTLAFPGGSAPESGHVRSELGSAPLQFSLEYRYYF